MNLDRTLSEKISALWEALRGLLGGQAKLRETLLLSEVSKEADHADLKPEEIDTVAVNSVVRICEQLGVSLEELLNFVEGAERSVASDTAAIRSERELSSETAANIINFHDHPLVNVEKPSELRGLSQKQLEEWIAKMTPGKSFPDKQRQHVPSVPNPWDGDTTPTPGR